MKSPRAVLILQHPSERKRPHGTVPLLSHHWPQTIVRVGLSWKNLPHALGSEPLEASLHDPKQWGVLYLGTGLKAHAIPRTTHQDLLLALNKKSEPLSPDVQHDVLSGLSGLIVLDGSWRDVKAMWWRNAWLLRCQRLILVPAQASQYKSVRKSPKRENLSTVEAAAKALKLMGEDAVACDRILVEFQEFLNRIPEKKTP